MRSSAERGRRVLVDGRSGSGKTEFARALVDGWPGAQLVRLDDVYPGWDGLDAGARHVVAHVLASDSPRWRRWDWALDRPAEWHGLDPARPIVVEGCGILRRESRPLIDVAVWLELDDAERKRRALARDGELYAPHWDRWAEQELAVIHRERPRELADLVLDGRDVAALEPQLRRVRG